MSNTIKPGELGAAIEDVLSIYSEEVNDNLRQATASSMQKLVKQTKATAPTGHRGTYKKKIAADYEGLNRSGGGGGLRGRTIKATWYVKAPDHRLTHLLVHGHATKNGGRTKADPFLQNALDEVLPEYEQEVEKALSLQPKG